MKITEQKLKAEEIMHKTKTEKNTRTRIQDLEQKFKKKEMDLAHAKTEARSTKQKMASKHALRNEQIASNHKNALLTVEKDIESKDFEQTKEVERKSKEIEEIKNLSEVVMNKRKLEMTVRSLNSMYISKMTINSFTDKKGLVSLFPQLELGDVGQGSSPVKSKSGNYSK